MKKVVTKSEKELKNGDFFTLDELERYLAFSLKKEVKFDRVKL